MRYREIPALPPLDRYVECFWTLTGDAPATPGSSERILPDGCMELILNFGEPFRRRREDGATETQPLLFLVGQNDRYLLLEPSGTVDVLGVRFRPSGAFPFLDLPVHELTGRFEPLEAIAARLRRAIEGRVYDCRTSQRRRSLLEAILLESLRGSRAPDIFVEEAVRWILVRRGQGSVGRLAAHLGISDRQLGRRFLERVGLAPKLFSRIIRFQNVFRAAERQEPGWAAVALECGYYDQAHLVKDFQQFSGVSPAALFSQWNEITEAFTRKDRVSEIYKTNG